MMRAKQFFAIFLLLVMLTSLTVTIPVAAQGTEAETTVTWNEIHEMINKTETKNVASWIFGPTLQIRFENLSGVELEDSAIGYDEWFKIVAVVPKNLIQENATLQFVTIVLQLREINVSAKIALHADVLNGRWLVTARVIDKSAGTYSAEIEDRVFIFNESMSQVINGTSTYEIEFVGKFGSNAPFGVYKSWMYVVDSVGQKIFPNWIQYAFTDLFPTLILGSPREFYFDVLDENGDPVISVERQEQITFRLRLSYGNVSEARWYFPTGIYTTVTVTVYNPFTGKTKTFNTKVWYKLIFTYSTSEGVDVDVGYDYFSWNSTTHRYDHIYVINETTDLFTLNATLSGGSGNEVNWTGEFTLNMAQGVFAIQRFEVKDNYGNYVKRAEITSAVGTVLGIERPILIARSISATTGEEIRHVNKNAEFNITIEVAGTATDISNLKIIRYHWVTIEKLAEKRWSRLDIYLEYDLSDDSYEAYYINATYTSLFWAVIQWFPKEKHDSKTETLPDALEVLGATKVATARDVQLNFKLKFTDIVYDEFYLVGVKLEKTDGKEFKIFSRGYIIKPTVIFRIGASPDWWFLHWTVTPSGALDLDGDLSTTDDQYYVKRVWKADINKTKILDLLFVDILWDPTPGASGDELRTFAWMGTVHHIWEYTWSEQFIWYYANNNTVVSPSTMNKINSTIWDSTTGKPKFGYWSISYLTRNVTSEEYKGKHWWLNQSKLEWTWFHFHTRQTYRTSISENSIGWSSFQTSYAGLLLFNDTDGNGAATFNVTDGVPMAYEISHVFLINNVSSVSFRRPFDSENATGTQTVTGNQTITFGVTIKGVKGVLLPTRVKRSLQSALKFYLTIDSMVGLDEKDFEKYPSRATIDEMSLTVHFTATTTGTEELNNKASMKIDQYIGNWELLDHNTTEMLTNRSLAIAYFGKLTNVTFVFQSGNQVIDSDQAYNATSFSFASNGTAKFADMNFGGSTYVWGKDNSTQTATSATEPYSAFKAMYELDTGESVAEWIVDRQTYFIVTAFPKWDGYSIYNDPEVVVYPSKETTTAGPGGEEEDTTTSFIKKILPLVVIAAVVLIVAYVIVKKVRK